MTTIERPSAERQHPAHQAASSDVIRTIDGVHAPTPGTWEIGRGQQIWLTGRRFRTRSVATRVAQGALVVTDELLGSSFDVTVLVPDTEMCVGFSTTVSRLVAVERWQSTGTATTAGGVAPVSLSLRSNGVFCQRRRPPSLWLTIQATLVLPDTSVGVPGRHTRRVRLDAELNLNPHGQLHP